MKKLDLKSGMVVSLRDWKEKFILIGNTLCSVTGKDFLLLDSYNDDLKHNYNDDLDITEAYKCEYPNLMSCFLENKLELIWERDEIDWSKVPIGTKVRVWDDYDTYIEGEGLFLEYLKDDSNYPFRVYVKDNNFNYWRNCELIEEPKEPKEEKEELTLEILHQEYLKYCEAFIVNDDCCDCKYIDNRHGCFSSFILKNYNVTRK